MYSFQFLGVCFTYNRDFTVIAQSLFRSDVTYLPTGNILYIILNTEW
jgi:hypothetical protein